MITTFELLLSKRAVNVEARYMIYARYVEARSVEARYMICARNVEARSMTCARYVEARYMRRSVYSRYVGD